MEVFCGPPTYRTSLERERAEGWTALVWTFACTVVLIIFGTTVSNYGKKGIPVSSVLVMVVPLLAGGILVLCINLLFVRRFRRRLCCNSFRMTTTGTLEPTWLQSEGLCRVELAS